MTTTPTTKAVILETYEFRLPTYAVCPLANGDYSGLEISPEHYDDDCRKIQDFEARLQSLVEKHKGTHYTIDFDNGFDNTEHRPDNGTAAADSAETNEPYFSSTNAFDNLGGDVLDIQVHIFGMVETIETYCPVFPGFYGTQFDTDLDGDSLDGEFNYIKETLGYDLAVECMDGSLCFDDIAEIDYQGYYKALSANIVDSINYQLRNVLNDAGDFTVHYQKLVSPREYNFKNDSIDIEIHLSKPAEFYKAIADYIKKNWSSFTNFIKGRYTSYSGFMSFYPSCAYEWLGVNHQDIQADTIVNLSDPEHKIGAILDFILENESYDSWDLYHDSTENVYLSQFVEIKVPHFEDLPGEFQDKILEIETAYNESDGLYHKYINIKPEFSAKAYKEHQDGQKAMRREYASVIVEIVNLP